MLKNGKGKDYWISMSIQAHRSELRRDQQGRTTQPSLFENGGGGICLTMKPTHVCIILSKWCDVAKYFGQRQENLPRSRLIEDKGTCGRTSFTWLAIRLAASVVASGLANNALGLLLLPAKELWRVFVIYEYNSQNSEAAQLQKNLTLSGSFVCQSNTVWKCFFNSM